MDLAQLGSLPQAAATLIAALVAWNVSRSWRKQQISKRRQEVAEEALLAVYNYRLAMDGIRLPAIMSWEMRFEDNALAAELPILRAVRNRFEGHGATFEAVRKVAVLVEVHFGIRIARRFRQLARFQSFTWIEMQQAIDKLPDSVRGAGPLAGDIRWRPMIDEASPSYRETTDYQIEQALEAIGKALKPYLRMPGEPDPDVLPVTWYRRAWGRMKAAMTLRQPNGTRGGPNL